MKRENEYLNTILYKLLNKVDTTSRRLKYIRSFSGPLRREIDARRYKKPVLNCLTTMAECRREISFVEKELRFLEEDAQAKYEASWWQFDH